MKRQKKIAASPERKRIPWEKAAKYFQDGWTLERIIGGRHNCFIALIVKRK